jgi:hypothetical protein
MNCLLRIVSQMKKLLLLYCASALFKKELGILPAEFAEKMQDTG